MSKQCECFTWCRDLSPPVTKHAKTCKHYDPVEELLECLKKLVRGVESWSQDEDGVHPDAWEAYKAAKWMIGEPVTEKDAT